MASGTGMAFPSGVVGASLEALAAVRPTARKQRVTREAIGFVKE